MKCFKNLVLSYPFQVYIEVSREHNIPLVKVIREKFRPEIKILIMYYNHKLRLEQKEYEKLEKEREKLEKGGENDSREY